MLRCGLKNWKSYASVRCSSVRFPEIRNLTVWFSEIWNPTVRVSDTVNPTVRFGAVRRGSLLNVFFHGAIPLPVGKTVQHRFFSTLHRMNKPYKTAVSYGSPAFFSEH